MKPRIYLCSRTKQDARPLNETVAEYLEQKGYSVFVPHRQPINNYTGASDKQIFEQDYRAMRASDVCVIVGDIGVDCAFEAGTFFGWKKPILYYRPDGTDYGRHPMLYQILQDGNYKTLPTLEEALRGKR